MNTFLHSRFIAFIAAVFLIVPSVQAQYLLNSDSAFKSNAPMTGRLWGYAFGDYYYKAQSDSMMRGGSNQYSSIHKDENAFAFRRVYLGYDFNISEKFSAELLLAAENWSEETDFSFFVKYANFRWKNIWKGTDLIVGQSVSPAFSNNSEKIWGYRAVERTIADIRRTPSFDMGVSLQGRFDSKGNYGYNLMIGNGTAALADNNKYKKFYGDVYAQFLDQKLMIDLYSDYERKNWQPGFHHSMNMVKLFIGYTTAPLSIGVEGFLNHGKQDVVGISGMLRDTLDANAFGVSLFARGKIVADKVGFFARMDFYNPDQNYDQQYANYEGLSAHFDPNTREEFVTAGLDFTPLKNVHLMPNVWYNAYHGQAAHLTAAAKYDYDLVYRMTFYYVFGK